MGTLLKCTVRGKKTHENLRKEEVCMMDSHDGCIISPYNSIIKDNAIKI